MKKDLGLYVHIPFCVRKCEYCDFLSWSAGEEAVSYTHLMGSSVAYDDVLFL